MKYVLLLCCLFAVAPAQADPAVDQALAQAAQSMYKPMPLDEVQRLSAVERARYILDNIYRAKAYHRFDEGKESRKAAVEAMNQVAETGAPAQIVRIWAALDAKFIGALNADEDLSLTTRRVPVGGERSVTVYALSWEDIIDVLKEYPKYRRAAARALVQMGASGGFNACRMFQGMYDLDADPFAGEPGVTWETVQGVAVRRSAHLAPLGKKTVSVALPAAVLTGCQQVRGGDDAHRALLEGHFKRLAAQYPPH